MELKSAYLLEGLSDDDYFSLPGISNSDFQTYLKKGIEAFIAKKYLGVKEEFGSAAALNFGTLFHTFLLEKDKFFDNYKLIEEYPASEKEEDFCQAVSLGKTPKEAYLAFYKDKVAASIEEKSIEKSTRLADYIQFLKEQRSNPEIKTCKTKEVELLSSMVKKLKSACLVNASDPIVSLFYKTIFENEIPENWEFKNEVVGVFKFLDLDFRCKIDQFFINHETKQIVLIDLKTTADSSRYGFQYGSMIKYGYYYQAALYVMFCHHCFPNYDVKFVFIACQKTAPYSVGFYKLQGQGLLDNISKLVDAILKFKPEFENAKPRMFDEDFCVSEIVDIGEDNKKYMPINSTIFSADDEQF